MDNNLYLKKVSGVGYLIVKVASGYGAIPLENAQITIRGIEPENNSVFYVLFSDIDGLSEKVSLPTVGKSESQTPTNKTPYSSYNIEVIKNGYYPQFYQNVPIFDGVLSIQTANLVPISSNNNQTYPSDEEYFNEKEQII